MRTSTPAILPLFRSEMQLRLLSLLLLQPERSWALQELAQALDAPASSVHRELVRAESAGIIRRDATARPHRFDAATDDPFNEPLVDLLRRSVGVEEQLRDALARPEVLAAAIYGSWASGTRRPDSDIDVIVIGDVDLRELRRRVRSIGKEAGRTVDLTVFGAEEFQRLLAENASFVRRILEAPTIPLTGNLEEIIMTTPQLVTGVDFVGCPTKDLKQAVAFYGETLGLPRSVYLEERNYSEFETGNLTLSVYNAEAMGLPHHANPNPIALHVDDVAAARAALQERGVAFNGETLDTGVCHMAFFADPDGNALMLHHRYAPRATQG